MFAHYLDEVQSYYIAYYQRPADPGGLLYWANRLYENGDNVDAIIEAFANSPEAQALYGTIDESTIDEVITQIYEAAFNRDPDPGGLDYYVQGFLEGRFTPSTIMIDIVNGAINDDAVILWNKVISAGNFTLAIDPDLDGKNFTCVYAGEDDILHAREFLRDVGLNSDTVKDEEEARLFVENVIAANDGAPPPHDGEDAHYTIEGVDSASMLSMDDPFVQALDSGYHWSTHKLSYSFNQSIPLEYTDVKVTNGWNPFSPEEAQVVEGIFQKISMQIGLHFVELPDQEGMIRFNHIETLDGMAGFAYMPSDYDEMGGDVFIDDEYDVGNGGHQPGTGGYDVLLHEIGHALGLKHPFEGQIMLPDGLDNKDYTVMSYTPGHNWVIDMNVEGDGTASWSARELAGHRDYALLDLAALQAIYGPDLETRTGDDSYDFSDLYEQRDFVTLWDAGGADTLDLSGTTHPDKIDLSPGTLSTVDEHDIDTQAGEMTSLLMNAGWTEGDANEFVLNALHWPDNQGGELYTGVNNLAIAYGTIIEDLRTGSANDVIFDNLVDNVICSGDGDDEIHMVGGGYDHVEGGEGWDSVYLPYDRSDARIDEGMNGQWYVAYEGDDPNFLQTLVLVGVEELHFEDQVFQLV